MTSIHEMTMSRLAEMHPQAHKNGFARAVRKVFRSYGDECLGFTPDFIPDLWWFDPPGDGRDFDRGTITCIEVEDPHPISWDKLQDYEHLWFDLDSVFCELRLLT